MNRMVSRIMIGLAVILASCAIALADRKADTVTFASNVTLGGATVKAGTYKVQFDDKTNQLSIISGNKAIANAAAHAEQGDRKARATQVETSSKDSNDEVTAVTFGGENRRIVVDGTSADTKSGSR